MSSTCWHKVCWLPLFMEQEYGWCWYIGKHTDWCSKQEKQWLSTSETEKMASHTLVRVGCVVYLLTSATFPTPAQWTGTRTEKKEFLTLPLGHGKKRGWWHAFIHNGIAKASRFQDQDCTNHKNIPNLLFSSDKKNKDVQTVTRVSVVDDRVSPIIYWVTIFVFMWCNASRHD